MSQVTFELLAVTVTVQPLGPPHGVACVYLLPLQVNIVFLSALQDSLPGKAQGSFSPRP